MSTASNFTTTVPTVQASPVQHAEFVRRGQSGFELVKQVLNLTFLIPIKPKVTRIETGLLIGHEFDDSRSILVNSPNGQVHVLEVSLPSVQDGVCQNPNTLEWVVVIDGEEVAWAESEPQARRSYLELAGEAY